jgi:hypothetical protein
MERSMVGLRVKGARGLGALAGWVVVMAAAASLVSVARAADKPASPPPKSTKPDLSEPVQEKTKWQGLSRSVLDDDAKEKGAKRKVQSSETSITITARDGEKLEFNYWITMGDNRGNADRRGLHVVGTIDRNGKIKASPTRIIAGSWKSAGLLDEKWTGEVVIEADKDVTRMVLRRPLAKGEIEIGVVKKGK